MNSIGFGQQGKPLVEDEAGMGAVGVTQKKDLAAAVDAALA